MNDINFTFIVLFFTIGFFIWGKLRSDLVALISMLALLLGGVLTTNDAFSGFSNSTVIMIAALFVVGEGLSRTGVTACPSGGRSGRKQLGQNHGGHDDRDRISLCVYQQHRDRGNFVAGGCCHCVAD
jgi:hypothetical protein